MKPTVIAAPKCPVACHPHPLSDELLATYKAMIDALPVGPIKSAMQSCYDCAFAWWNVRESKKSYKEKWTTGEGKTYSIIPFDDELIETLDGSTPWSYEVDAMQSLFLAIQADETERNSELIDAWQVAVHTHVIGKHFPDASVFHVLQKNRRAVGEILPLLSADEQVAIRAKYEKVTAAVAEIHAAIQAKQYPGISYPVKDPTVLRDAAMHLHWFAEQITRDREPPTKDKLV